MSSFIKALGRPAKYSYILPHLEDDKLYYPAKIAHFARDNNLLQCSAEDVPKVVERVRSSMIRLSNARDFPDHGDGYLFEKGKPPMPSWYGWRWKSAFNNYGNTPKISD